jgi:hypothetical protein
VALGRYRDLRVLRAVDDNVLRHDTALDFAHLRVFTSTTEQGRGLNFEVTDLFLVPVDRAETVLLQKPLVLFFYRLDKDEHVV